MSVFVFRRDVAGQRHAAPLQADGLAGRPAAPHGGGGRQEGGVVMVGSNAQGTTSRRPFCHRTNIYQKRVPGFSRSLCLSVRRLNCCMKLGTSDGPIVRAAHTQVFCTPTLSLSLFGVRYRLDFFINASSDSA